MNLETVDPLTLPSLPLATRAELPNCPAIYFVLNGDAVLYIGRTSNLYQRWIADHRWHQLKVMSGDIRIAWLECGDASLLSEIETALIKHIQPCLNQTKVECEGISIKTKTMVYMPPELREALERMAAKENRSLSNLIVTLLQRAVEEQKGNESGKD
ncbi:hypothetical protein [Microseira sp. BLCC-F43]|uniref:ribbon-helix-helix domain-containing protein n=1 Tax=Microseira sp. BLCC-F43 TaxID=3153602 RepID=UPI0035B9A98F